MEKMFNKKVFLFVSFIFMLLAILISFINLSGLVSAESVELSVLEDSYVSDVFADINLGSFVYLLVSSGNEKAYSYLKFDIIDIPEDQEINKAEICLNLFSSFNNGEIKLMRVDDEWSENSINWNNQPCGAELDLNCSEIGSSIDISEDEIGIFCIDIRDFIRGKYLDKVGEVSFVIYPDFSLDYTAFFWSAQGSDAPYLNIDYSTDTTPPEITNIGYSPENVYVGDNVELFADVDDTNLQEIWIEIKKDKVLENIILSISDDNKYVYQLGGLQSYQEIEWKWNARDRTENIASTEWFSFTVQNRKPNKPELKLADDLYVKGNSVLLSFSGSDPDADSLVYYVYISKDNKNFDLIANTSDGKFLMEDLDEGKYYWYVISDDGFLKSEKSDTQIFGVDFDEPIISLSQPAGVFCSEKNIPLNFLIDDEAIDKCYYSVEREGVKGEEILIDGCNNVRFDIPDFDKENKEKNRFILYFKAVDKAGNSADASIDFSIDPEYKKCIDMEVTVSQTQIKTNAQSQEILYMNIKNKGTRLENCVVKIKSINRGLQVYSKEKDIDHDKEEGVQFRVDVSEIEIGSYEIEVYLSCNNAESGSIPINIGISEKILGLSIENIERIKESLKISYSVRELKNLSDEVKTSFWLEDDLGKKVMRNSDAFILESGEIKQRTGFLNLSNIKGDYILVLNAELDGQVVSVKEDVIISGGGITGFVSFEGTAGKGKLIILVLLTVVVLYFIARKLLKKAKTRKIEHGGVVKVKSKG